MIMMRVHDESMEEEVPVIGRGQLNNHALLTAQHVRKCLQITVYV